MPPFGFVVQSDKTQCVPGQILVKIPLLTMVYTSNRKLVP
jgi:hypothetical protein